MGREYQRLVAACDHKKPIFQNGKTRKVCFSCVPKAHEQHFPTYDRTCPICDTRFTTKRRVKVCCSNACACKLRDRRNAKFGDRTTYVSTLRAQSRFNFTCDQCGAAFYRRGTGSVRASIEEGKPPRFCSKECQYQNWSLNKEASFCQYFAGPCRTCSEPTANRHGGPLECRRCLRERRLREGREENKRTKVEWHRANPPTRRCDICSTPFTPLYGFAGRRACSDECDKRRLRIHRIANKIKRIDVERDRRRAIKKVDPIKVFERDGWHCRLCGVPTPLALRNKNLPNSPELDHVVPVSRGGEHSYANTQLLCRSCNGDKRNLLPHEL